MKLLLFSDLHCDASAACKLVDQSHEVDVVVGAGDFGSVRQGIDTTIQVLKSIDLPAALVAGNAESVEELTDACETWPTAHVLHGSAVTINDVVFYGLGGAVPVTPFGSWSYDFTEQQATELLADCPQHCVLVTHSPPKGAADADSRGQHLGSVAVRETIESKNSLLVVCGHIHASQGKTEFIGQTPVVNAGPRGIVREL